MRYRDSWKWREAGIPNPNSYVLLAAFSLIPMAGFIFAPAILWGVKAVEHYFYDDPEGLGKLKTARTIAKVGLYISIGFILLGIIITLFSA